MIEDVLKRIEERLKALNLSASAASLKAGLSRDAIRNMRRGLKSQARTGVSTNTIEALARVLQVSPAWLLKGNDADKADDSVKLIPVYGMAAGAFAGAFTMTTDEVERVPAPPGLAHVRDAYALIVTGSSMEPRYFAGDTIFVNPHRPPRPGDHVIVQIRDHRPEGRQTFIKRFVGETQGEVVVSQYNPPQNTAWKREHVALLHRVLTTNELLGV